LFKILCGAHTGPGLAPNGIPQRAEGSSRFWGKQNERFLGTLRHSYVNALLVCQSAPCLNRSKPRNRGGIRGAAQKSNHHQITHRLAVGQIRMHPEPVSRL
jgi:hypothetical protein